MFHNSGIFNVPFKDNCSVCYFSILAFSSFVINSILFSFYYFKASKADSNCLSESK